ncbi:MAG: outer membrane beta-barrel protein [Aliifodinibius sp.]|nr:porin family protein [Fodinibius sp.]NIV14860.1 outer membrane beta-barrel protein [Fodinibius sp.]NIY27273.1 outer membrane beta-barrel protein [Fodinibius sp.]
MKKLLLLPLLALVFAPMAVQAQTSSNATIKNTLGIGPRLGYYKANDADEGSFYIGAQTRARLGSVLGVEGSVEYRAAQEYTIGGQSFETKFVPVTASALLFLPVSENFAPYGVAGLGAYYTIYEFEGVIDDVENEFNFGYHLGFGLELPINENAALNFDYRYLFLNPEANEVSTDNTNYNGNVFTAGLMFYL